jgi:aspartyl-tRNA(Asn)/glutamyl-tRNA(Gln) amidotransferase subunit B
MLTHRSQVLPSQLAKDLSLMALSSPTSISPKSELELLCDEAINDMPNEVAVVQKQGEGAQVINKIIGKVMKSSRGRADAKAVREVLKKKILKEWK